MENKQNNYPDLFPGIYKELDPIANSKNLDQKRRDELFAVAGYQVGLDVRDKLNRDIRELKLLILKYEQAIKDIYDACTCERHKTRGFDYHENHPNLGWPSAGSRWMTPRSIIENRIGFDWVYKDMDKPGASRKRIKFKLLIQPTNYKSEEEWKAIRNGEL